MENKIDRENYQIWDDRWAGSEHEEKLTPLGRLMFKAKKRVLLKVIPQLDIGSVIEVGCGLGYTLSVYRELGIDSFGIDVSKHAVAVCRNKGLKVELQKLEDVRDQFDLVSSDGMLEHFLNFEFYARYLMDVSRKYVLLIQPNHGSFWGKTLAYLSELIRGDKNVFEYNYRIIDFITVFSRYDFKIIRNHPVFLDVFRLLVFERQTPAA